MATPQSTAVAAGHIGAHSHMRVAALQRWPAGHIVPTPQAAEALRRELGRHGVQFSDVRRIVLTHAHEDHCGLAKQVRDEAKNAEIYIHEWETGHLFGRLAHDDHRNLMMRSGVPAGVFDERRGMYEEISLLTDSLADGDFHDL
jgi:glyoxylase-like metal-dependent hydrolase (beta-lactamase superfamily II)